VRLTKCKHLIYLKKKFNFKIVDLIFLFKTQNCLNDFDKYGSQICIPLYFLI
jgi:hypothetical protein